MKRFLFFSAVLGLCLGSVWAEDVTVQEVQSQLKARGFYHGSPNGVYDSETSAAVTRYQIRNGLAISGKLDAATLKALRVVSATEAPAPEASPQEGTWRRLRNGDMQFLKDLNAGKIPPPATPPPVRSTPVGATPVPSPVRKNRAATRSAPPVPAQSGETSSGSSQPEEVAPESNERNASRERLRDYVGAFVLAGLDPRTGAELEFFADRVNYFGEKNVSREKVRRDLIRYDKRWPERRFWLAGDLKIDRGRGGEVRVTFPLRYDLRREASHASGKVWKTIVLQESGANDFKIVGVSERKS